MDLFSATNFVEMPSTATAVGQRSEHGRNKRCDDHGSRYKGMVDAGPQCTSIVSPLLWPRLASYWPVRNIQFGGKKVVQSEKQVATGRAPKMGARRTYEAIKHQILRRVYEAGSQLPSSRSLANGLHVSRTTVTVVYEQLAAEGASWNCTRARVHAVTA
ncbi:hypothetical protein A8M32_08565 [Sinorhizobium alkalisoli]|uniref:HTH gntR-type domain-containing protein n=1 Tax=Sinorhizobium alkalisoli TaxID=1752398 RepID=A0A1E3VDU0_9HYPH|nr:hypothetical protein A8M32_08565 [Sinorhizobium alkalisoli]